MLKRIETIRKSLIEACEKGDADIFKSALYFDEVKVEFENKEDFYISFQERIREAYSEVEEKLYLKVRNHDNELKQSFEFFSKNYVYSRLCIHVKETASSFEIELMPF
jgi:hypothetical protein